MDSKYIKIDPFQYCFLRNFDFLTIGDLNFIYIYIYMQHSTTRDARWPCSITCMTEKFNLSNFSGNNKVKFSVVLTTTASHELF